MADFIPKIFDLSYIANSLGASESALRILFTLILGYPFAVFYRCCLYGTTPNLQHIFFTLCGIWMCYFNFGAQVVHSVANILIIYVLLLVCGGSLVSVLLAFLINMSYLCIGYYLTMTDSYQISWTTPQCVLALRLIGLVFDVYDGAPKQRALTPDETETALQKRPSLLEISGHSYFFGGFLVGPQFPMKRYQNFVSGDFTKTDTDDHRIVRPRSVSPAIMRLAAGIFYTLVYQAGSLVFPDSIFFTDSFLESTLVCKCLIITVWGKLTLYKYVGCWLIAEGVGILTGLTYNGRDENGNELWDGCANIHIRAYEVASSCRELILAFNVNTNKWMAKYVFKRLKFLGNKDISQGATLFFLALWHGLYSGYYMNFFLEFVIIKFENEIGPILNSMALINWVLTLPGGWFLVWTSKKFYAQFVLGYALISFCLFTFHRYWAVYTSVYYVGHIAFILVWPTFYLVYSSMRSRSAHEHTQ